MPDTPNSDLTLGEIHRNLLALRTDFKELREGLDDRPDWKDLNRAEASIRLAHDQDIATQANQIVDVKKTITELQDNAKWSMRLVLTSILGLVINIIYSAASAPGIS